MKANEIMQACDLIAKDGFESISNVGVLSPDLSFGAIPNQEGLKSLLGQFYGTMKAIMITGDNIDIKPEIEEINSYSDYVQILAEEQMNAIAEGDE